MPYIKLNDLTRPDGWAKKRIDVTVITSGNFRDLYSTQAILMDNAFRVALARSYFTILNDGALKANPYYNDMKDGLEHIVASVDYYGVGKETFEEKGISHTNSHGKSSPGRRHTLQSKSWKRVWCV